MKLIKSVVFIIISIIILLPACSAAKTGHTQTPVTTTPAQEAPASKPAEQEPTSTSGSSEYSDPSVTIEQTVGKAFTISVHANPSTGYLWTPGFDQSKLTMERRYIPDKPQLLGSGGIENFEFTGITKGSTEIRFKYERPFASDSPVLETVIYKVIIR